jgi:hypothetical protein
MKLQANVAEINVISRIKIEGSISPWTSQIDNAAIVRGQQTDRETETIPTISSPLY